MFQELVFHLQKKVSQVKVSNVSPEVLDACISQNDFEAFSSKLIEFLKIDFISGCNWSLMDYLKSNINNKSFFENLCQYLKSKQGCEYQYLFGVCLFLGLGIERDMRKAIEYFRPSIEESFAPGINSLGYCLFYGDGIERNREKAIEFYTKSGELGYARSLYNLGLCYESGKGVKKDFTAMFQLYQRAAFLGHIGAVYKLGECFEEGKGVAKNEESAIEVYTIGANQGNSDSMCNLGYYFENQNNLERAIHFYRKAVALENPLAMSNLGACYEKGRGVDQNLKYAFELYYRAANAGRVKAIFSCYKSLMLGIGVKRDPNVGVKYLFQLEEKNFKASFVEVGLHLLFGTFVERNEARALKCFQLGSESCILRSKFWFGYCLIEGIGIERNFFNGLEYARESSLLGLHFSHIYLSSVEPEQRAFH